MASRPKKDALLLIFLVLVCGLLGGILGEVLGEKINVLYFLKKYFSIGLKKPIVLDLNIISITFGINFKFNILSLIGMITGFFIYKRS